MTQDEIIEMADRAFDESSVTDAEVIRFAELIVKECAEVVKWTPSVFPNDIIIKNIKEHFGVEE